MRAAVLGSPIAHSLSPVLHNAGYAALGLGEWEYGRFELVADDLPGFVARLDDEWRGLSLTMPLKEACLDVADEATPVARRARAANTLVRRPDGGWLADNTDVPGLVDALLPAWQPSWQHVAVLGSGATARSALLALPTLGVTSVDVYARNLAKAATLEEWAPSGLELAVLPLEQWTSDDQLVVLSTLPGGAADGFTLPGPRTGLLFDVVYAGWPTPLARTARSAGMTVVGGLDLLVHQAARQFALFTGLEAPVEAMFAAGRAVLDPPAGSAPRSQGPSGSGGNP